MMNEIVGILKSVEFWTIAGAIGTILGVLLTIIKGNGRTKFPKAAKLPRRESKRIINNLKGKSLTLYRAQILKGLRKEYQINKQNDEYRQYVLNFISGTIDRIKDIKLSENLAKFQSKLEVRRNTNFDKIIAILEDSSENQILKTVFQVFKDIAPALMTEKVAASIEQDISESLTGFKTYKFRLNADNVFNTIYSELIGENLVDHRVSELTNESFYQLSAKGKGLYKSLK